MLRKLLLHISHYSVGSLLVAVASLISFPFLTRVFSVTDYGVMNLVSATITALVAVGKLGLQHSVVRFSRDLRADRVVNEGRKLVSTTVLGMAVTGSVVAFAWSVTVWHIPLDWLGNGRIRFLFFLAAALVLLQTVESALTNLLRAQQRSVLYTTYWVLNKYAGLGLMIGALLLIRRDLVVFYNAQLVASLLGLCALAAVMFRGESILPQPTLRDFSASLYKKMLRYGVPMMLGWELAGIILMLGDRYLIQVFLGSELLGIYSAAYNLCLAVAAVLLTPWATAIMPMYMRLWEENGEPATSRFLQRSLHYYTLLGLPIIAGVLAVGPELLTFLASEKYRAGAGLLPAIVAGLVFAGAIPIAGAGIFIQKDTWRIARYVFSCAVLNLALNALLLPLLGIQGAALATLVSYGALYVWVSRFGSRRLSVPTPWGAVGRVGVASLVMYAVVTNVSVGGQALTLTIKIGVGVFVYAIAVVLLEPTVRRDLAVLIEGFKGMRS